MAPECKVTFCFTFKPNVFQLWHSASAGMCFVMTPRSFVFNIQAPRPYPAFCVYVYVRVSVCILLHRVVVITMSSTFECSDHIDC